jgi:hypothetical protein
MLQNGSNRKERDRQAESDKKPIIANLRFPSVTWNLSTDILYYTEVLWLIYGQMPKCVHDFKSETELFLRLRDNACP